jgi:hypothetical protein
LLKDFLKDLHFVVNQFKTLANDNFLRLLYLRSTVQHLWYHFKLNLETLQLFYVCPVLTLTQNLFCPYMKNSMLLSEAVNAIMWKGKMITLPAWHCYAIAWQWNCSLTYFVCPGVKSTREKMWDLCMTGKSGDVLSPRWIFVKKPENFYVIT